jgi:hypothetical protein
MTWRAVAGFFFLVGWMSGHFIWMAAAAAAVVLLLLAQNSRQNRVKLIGDPPPSHHHHHLSIHLTSYTCPPLSPSSFPVFLGKKKDGNGKV